MITDDFNEILEKYWEESSKPLKDNEFAIKMRNDFTNNLQSFVDELVGNTDYKVKISPGSGEWTNEPYAGIRNTKFFNTFKSGLYPVYSFRGDSGFYLSIGQGVSDTLKKNRKNIEKGLVNFLKESDTDIPNGFNLDSDKLDDEFIISKFYPKDNITINEFKSDLKQILDIYELLIPRYIDLLLDEEPNKNDLRPEKDGIRIWRIAPGSSDIYDEAWEEFKRNSYVGISFTKGKKNVDFTQFKNKYAFNLHLNNLIFVSDSTNMVWKFVKWVRKGDIVVVNKGRSKLAGIGVIDGEFIPETENQYKNNFDLNSIYPVKWIMTPDDLEVKKYLFSRLTLVELSNLADKWNELVFTLSRTDENLKDRLLNYLFSSFDNNYLKTDVGLKHQLAYKDEGEYIRDQWYEITKKEENGENISEDIWDKIINRDNKLHNDAVNDIKAFIKSKFKYSDEEIAKVSRLYYDTINKVIKTDEEYEQKAILKEYSDDRYSDGFATGRFTPVLHYLKPKFHVINNKNIETVKLLSLILGEKLELNSALENYIDNNNKYIDFLAKLKDISPYKNIDISKFETADAFAHWLCDSRLGNFAGKKSNLIPPELILDSDFEPSCDIEELFDFPENLNEEAIEIFKDLYCHMDKWYDNLSGEGITISEYFKLQSGSISEDNLSSYFDSLLSSGFLSLVSDEPKRYEIANKIIEKYTPVNLDYELFESKLQGFAISDDLIYQTCASLNAGKHIIFDGTPGTGKTELALKFSSVASENKFVDGHVLTTATSDWSTFDTIGGLMPKKDGSLEFRKGKFLEAIEDNKWLIIDEINRADIDKAFGQLFTVLSGQDVELPYKENDKPIKIKTWDELYCKHDEKTATYYIGSNWRIIGTMNVDDKDSLFDLSYAFMRRFMFIEVDLPSDDEYLKIIGQWSNDLNRHYQDKLRDLHGIIEYRKLGPAIFKDMISYIRERDKLGSPDYDKVLGEAIDSYILPQLEGLNKKTIGNIKEFLEGIGLFEYISDKFEDLTIKL